MSMAQDRLRASRRGASQLSRFKIIALIVALALVLIAMWQLSLVVEEEESTPPPEESR